MLLFGTSGRKESLPTTECRNMRDLIIGFKSMTNITSHKKDLCFSFKCLWESQLLCFSVLPQWVFHAPLYVTNLIQEANPTYITFIPSNLAFVFCSQLSMMNIIFPVARASTLSLSHVTLPVIWLCLPYLFSCKVPFFLSNNSINPSKLGSKPVLCLPIYGHCSKNYRL